MSRGALSRWMVMTGIAVMACASLPAQETKKTETDIVYLIDAPLVGDEAFAIIVRNLKRSVSNLQKQQAFDTILLTANGPRSFVNDIKATHATKKDFKQWEKWIDRMKMPEKRGDLPSAFLVAAQLKPRMIFYLAGGQGGPADNKERDQIINTITGKKKIVCHVVQLGPSKNENRLKTIAAKSKGVFKKISKKDLRRQRS
ncbi:MAG: hypothetical protein R3236_00355 [Phycisphaeraceae bacterium]|nr:hypothetical protein [Phycisphaeraceae bacterium]